MSYRCGLDVRVAALMGTDAGPPRFTCDGCGVRYTLRENKMPPAWFFDGKAPPGWRSDNAGTPERKDWCKACRDTVRP